MLNNNVVENEYELNPQGETFWSLDCSKDGCCKNENKVKEKLYNIIQTRYLDNISKKVEHPLRIAAYTLSTLSEELEEPILDSMAMLVLSVLDDLGVIKKDIL